MTTDSAWVALLRAINVGKHNRIPMAELRALMADLGFPDAATHLQSGNVLFCSDKPGHELQAAIAGAVNDRYGYDTAVIVRNASDLERIVDNVPFADPHDKSSGVVFMSGAPTEAFDAERFAPDQLAVAGSDIYVDLPSGFGKTKLTVDWIERNCGLLGTRRNWKTVTTLRAQLSELTATIP